MLPETRAMSGGFRRPPSPPSEHEGFVSQRKDRVRACVRSERVRIRTIDIYCHGFNVLVHCLVVTMMTTRQKRQTLKGLTQEIIQHKAQAGRNFYEMGTRLDRVRSEKLWKIDYPSFQAYLHDAVGLSRTTAYRLIHIAHHFNAAIARRYGVEKLSAALAYLQATRIDEAPGDLLATEITVRTQDGTFRAMPLHQATARQIREAVALLQARNNPGHGIAKKTRARIEQLTAALPKAPPGSRYRGNRVRLKKSSNGRLVATFQAIPLDELEDFIAALEMHLSV